MKLRAQDQLRQPDRTQIEHAKRFAQLVGNFLAEADAA